MIRIISRILASFQGSVASSGAGYGEPCGEPKANIYTIIIPNRQPNLINLYSGWVHYGVYHVNVNPGLINQCLLIRGVLLQ